MRCKQGQLAWIKKSMRMQNVGLVVECRKHLGYFIQGEAVNEFCVAIITDHYWEIYSPNKSITVIDDAKTDIAYIADTWLTPINPINPDEVTDVEELFETDLVTSGGDDNDLGA